MGSCFSTRSDDQLSERLINNISLSDLSSNETPTISSQIGVHISVFRDLLKKFPGLTTEQLCQKLIKEEHASHQDAYFKLLEGNTTKTADGKKLPLISAAKCFISHAWMCPFADVVDCAEQYEKNNPNTYFWFDMFVNNQHKAISFPFEWWCSTFRENINSIGAVILVMSPWNNPVPLTRAWCLWEIFSTMVVNAKMMIAIPSTQREAFETAIVQDSKSVLKSICKLDAQKAVAKNPKDRDNIFDAIRGDVGFDNLNIEVIEHLREWYITTCINIAEEKFRTVGGNVEHAAKIFWNIGLILQEFGQTSKSILYFEKCLKVQQQVVAEKHLDVASTYNNLGNAYKTNGEYNKSLECLLTALRIRENFLEAPNPEIAASLNNLGTLYHHQGNYTEAINFHKRVLQIRLSVFGERHLNTAASYGNIGIALDGQGNYEEAIKYHEKSLNIKLDLIGAEENHPCIAASYTNIGLAYYGKAEYQKALHFHQKSLVIRLKIFGENHSGTASCYENLGQVFEKLGLYDMAMDFQVKAFDLLSKMLDPNHPDLAFSLNHIGDIYRKQKLCDPAIEKCTQALTIRKKLGDRHPDTAVSYCSLGEAYSAKGDFQTALKYCIKSLNIRLATIGEAHPVIADSYQGIGTAHHGLGNMEAARQHFNKALEIRNRTFGANHPEVLALEELINYL